MLFTVDRIEGKYAICEQEDGEMVNIPLSKLPFEVEEGSVFEKNGQAYALKESARKKRVGDLMDELWG